ncbi:hypothetical protein KIN20_007376 [Parelaphostrongylus tenuis]|uniref:Saposin B-type domain-containing protein n=1 Tax=Parelaphostrongylus tenuis TaxID=148309 RepID=A0AAD5QJ52_PARTN|nr:hypothetical protein KIN20_007376 [Parelaphostrongylus tenuis]
MIFASYILPLLSVTSALAFIQQTFDRKTTPCDMCFRYLTDVQNIYNHTTHDNKLSLREAAEKACTKYEPGGKSSFCKGFGDAVADQLEVWLQMRETSFTVLEACEHFRFCPGKTTSR